MQSPSLQQFSAGQWFDAWRTALPDPAGIAPDSQTYRMQTDFVYFCKFLQPFLA